MQLANNSAAEDLAVIQKHIADTDISLSRRTYLIWCQLSAWWKSYLTFPAPVLTELQTNTQFRIVELLNSSNPNIQCCALGVLEKMALFYYKPGTLSPQLNCFFDFLQSSEGSSEASNDIVRLLFELTKKIETVTPKDSEYQKSIPILASNIIQLLLRVTGKVIKTTKEQSCDTQKSAVELASCAEHISTLITDEVHSNFQCLRNTLINGDVPLEMRESILETFCEIAAGPYDVWPMFGEDDLIPLVSHLMLAPAGKASELGYLKQMAVHLYWTILKKEQLAGFSHLINQKKALNDVLSHMISSLPGAQSQFCIGTELEIYPIVLSNPPEGPPSILKFQFYGIGDSGINGHFELHIEPCIEQGLHGTCIELVMSHHPTCFLKEVLALQTDVLTILCNMAFGRKSITYGEFTGILEKELESLTSKQAGSLARFVVGQFSDQVELSKAMIEPARCKSQLQWLIANDDALTHTQFSLSCRRSFGFPLGSSFIKKLEALGKLNTNYKYPRLVEMVRRANAAVAVDPSFSPLLKEYLIWTLVGIYILKTCPGDDRKRLEQDGKKTNGGNLTPLDQFYLQSRSRLKKGRLCPYMLPWTRTDHPVVSALKNALNEEINENIFSQYGGYITFNELVFECRHTQSGLTHDTGYSDLKRVHDGICLFANKLEAQCAPNFDKMRQHFIANKFGVDPYMNLVWLCLRDLGYIPCPLIELPVAVTRSHPQAASIDPARNADPEPEPARINRGSRRNRIYPDLSGQPATRCCAIL